MIKRMYSYRNNKTTLSWSTLCFQKPYIFLLQHLTSIHWIKTAPIEADAKKKKQWIREQGRELGKMCTKKKRKLLVHNTAFSKLENNASVHSLVRRKTLTIHTQRHYLPSRPTMMTVFWEPKAVMNCVSSGKRNWAKDHSELKYLGKTPGKLPERLDTWRRKHQKQLNANMLQIQKHELTLMKKHICPQWPISLLLLKVTVGRNPTQLTLRKLRTSIKFPYSGVQNIFDK